MLQCEILDRPARAQLRRQQLLEAARRLFVEQGFHQTGMAQIAAASGIKVGQIYRDFESKEAIIAAIAEADVTGWLEEEVLAEAVAQDDVVAIRAWIDRFVDCDEPPDTCQMMTEILAEGARNPRICNIHREIDMRLRCNLTAALEALVLNPGKEEGIALLVDFILASGTGIMVRRIVNPEMDVEAVGRLVRTIMDHKLDLLMQ